MLVVCCGGDAGGGLPPLTAFTFFPPPLQRFPVLGVKLWGSEWGGVLREMIGGSCWICCRMKMKDNICTSPSYSRLKMAALILLLSFILSSFWFLRRGTAPVVEKSVVFFHPTATDKLLAFSSSPSSSNPISSIGDSGKLGLQDSSTDDCYSCSTCAKEHHECSKEEEEEDMVMRKMVYSEEGGGSSMDEVWEESMSPETSLMGACFSWLLVGVTAVGALKWVNVTILDVRNIRNRARKKAPAEKKKEEQEEKRNNNNNERVVGEERDGGNMRMKTKMMVKIFLCAGVIWSVCLFRRQSEEFGEKRKEIVMNMCDERAKMLQDGFNVSMNQVRALADLVSVFHHGKNPSAIDQRTFEEYTERTAFDRPLTSGVAYALRVAHWERGEFERAQGWSIKKMEKEDQTLVQDCSTDELDPSPFRDEYAPVIFSQQTVSHIVSIDMMSGMEDRKNILRARASGNGVLTSPFKLLKSNHLGVVLTFAVYKTYLSPNATPEQRIAATVGYLGASFDIPSLVEKLLQQMASKETIMVNVYDTTNASAPITMYGGEPVDTGLVHVSHLDFGDPSLRHEMHCRFKQRPPLPWNAITSSLGILVITLLLSYIFLVTIHHVAKVEADYTEMMKLKIRAEAADVAKSQFLAMVSHEIRTPMNGVLGILQMLMDTEMNPTQLDLAHTAHNSGRDLIYLINDVLDHAKIESGKLDLEAVTFDSREVLDNVLSLFSGRSREKGIELAVFVSDLVPEALVGDPGRFRQIITNLVGNSLKFARNKGHVFVSIGLAHEVGRHQGSAGDEWPTLSGLPIVDRSKSWRNFKDMRKMEEEGVVRLLVTVEDTGEGIPHHVQGRIFTPFVQADSSTSRTYGGTGIGLTICKRLVDLMCGDIGFVSEPGIGSTFSFTAIFREGQSGPLDSKRKPSGGLMASNTHALVVDGRRTRAEVVRYHLKRLGICSEAVPDLHSNISDVPSTRKELSMVFVDEEVWKGGEEMRVKLGQWCCGESAKIYVLTNSMNDELDEAKKKGAVDQILLKPLRLSVVLRGLKDTSGFSHGMVLSPSSSPPTLGHLLKGRRILVVDDNAVNRRVAEGALKKYGASVVCVENGREALVKLKPPHDFDACFMDLQMPQMDGFEATRRIRSTERLINERIELGELEGHSSSYPWHVPILAMTADIFQATNGECLKCGMDDYVSKPFEEHQLYAAVSRFFHPR